MDTLKPVLQWNERARLADPRVSFNPTLPQVYHSFSGQSWISITSLRINHSSDCCPGQATACDRGSKEMFALVQKNLFKSLRWKYYQAGTAHSPRTEGWDSGHFPSRSGTWIIHSGLAITRKDSLLPARPHGAQVNPRLGRCDISLIPAFAISRFTALHKEQGVGFAMFVMLCQISVWDALCLILVPTLWGRQSS